MEKWAQIINNLEERKHQWRMNLCRYSPSLVFGRVGLKLCGVAILPSLPRTIQIYVCSSVSRPLLAFKCVLIWMITEDIILGLGNILKCLQILERYKTIWRNGACDKLQRLCPAKRNYHSNKKESPL